MSAITAEEASLFHDAEFLHELEQFARADEDVPEAADAHPGSSVYDAALGAIDALEIGLPMDSTARPTGAPHHERAPYGDRLGESYEAPVERPAPAEQRVPFVAVAIVLACCLTFGAATAALVFHDRLTHLSALQPATR